MKIKPQLRVYCLALTLTLGLAGSLGSAPVKITNTPGWYDASPRMAVDAIGNIHLAWAQYYGNPVTTTTTGDAMYSKYDVFTGQWTTPLNLSCNSQVHSEEYRPVGIDVDGSGNVYVIYVERFNKKVKMRIQSGGNWGAPFDVSTAAGTFDTARVAVTPSGDIYASWWNMGEFRCYSRARIGGTWESVKFVGGGKFPDIAVGAGAAFMTWTSRNQAGIYQIYYAQRATTYESAWSSPQLLSANSLKQQTPTIEVDSNDIPHIVFAQFIAEGGIRRMDYSYWDGNGFTPPLPLSGTTLSHYPSMCERGNNIFVTWQVGAWLDGTSVNFNEKVMGAWRGAGTIAGSLGCTYPDVATSPYQDKVYYVWDADNELWFDSRTLFSMGLLPIYHGHDFNGDGISDIGVWRQTDGNFYLKDISVTNWGQQGDAPANGDYNGDGTTDIAVWRPSNGYWFIKDFGEFEWGSLGDVPVPGDYDGDGATELAVWKPSGGLWVIQDVGIIQWGSSGDIPVPADYDGDGATDLAVWRMSTGTWYIRNVGAFQWGMAGDIPVPGDYNGDLAADVAVWRPSQGMWYVRNIGSFQWGVQGDIPVPGRYDVGPTTDVAIWRPSQGIWYVRNIGSTNWGMSGDIPLVK